MSDVQRPLVLTLLGVLAIITGVFSIVRGGLMIFGGISQMTAGVGGIPEIVIGVLSLAVGAAALACGIMVLIDRAAGVPLMQKYAIGLIAYNVIWVGFAVVSGGKISWASVVFETAICLVTLSLIRTNDEIKAYLASFE